MIKERKEVYKGYFSVDSLTVETNSGRLVNREVMNRKDGVGAIVYNTISKKFIFVEQWRPGSDSKMMEVPAGLLDIVGEDPIEAIEREIMEEIGYKVDKIELITKCYMSPGGTTEELSLYYCEVSEQVELGGGLEDEDITIFEIHKDNLSNYSFVDGKTIICTNYAIKKLNIK